LIIAAYGGRSFLLFRVLVAFYFLFGVLAAFYFLFGSWLLASCLVNGLAFPDLPE